MSNYWSVQANIIPDKKKSMAIDWAHMEKAPKQNYQTGIRLESTRPENTRETTTQFEKDKNERI